MIKSTNNPFSAGEQALGYTYQARFALLRLLQLPEETAVLMEKDDDLDFMDDKGMIFIANKSDGIEEGKLWFSNGGHEDSYFGFGYYGGNWNGKKFTKKYEWDKPKTRIASKYNIDTEKWEDVIDEPDTLDDNYDFRKHRDAGQETCLLCGGFSTYADGLCLDCQEYQNTIETQELSRTDQMRRLLAAAEDERTDDL